MYCAVFIRCTTCCHSLSLIVICCDSLSFIVTRCHSLSLVLIRCTTCCHSLCHSLLFVVTCCHSLSLVVPALVVTRCHSLSIDVPLVCLFINDPIIGNNAQNSLQFALRQPEKKNLLVFLYFYVDKTVDNRLFQKRETGKSVYSGQRVWHKTYYYGLPVMF